MLPPALIEHAGLGREVVVVGMRDRLEIWDRAAWRAQLKEVKGVQSMLPNVLQPNTTDHVPVLADEVRELLRRAAGRHARRRHLRRRRPRVAARARPEGQGQGDRDRPRPDRRARTSSASARTAGVNARFLRGDFSIVLEQLAENGVQADAILLDLGVSSMQLDRPERGFSYAADAPLDMRMDPSAELLGARARQRGLASASWSRSSAATARSATRGRSPARSRRRRKRAAVRAHGRPRRDDQGGDPRARALRRRPPGEARLPGAADRGQRRARRARARRCRRRSRCCGPGGRLAVISFHSLEDRIVKHFFREEERGCICPPDFPVCVCGHEPALRVLDAQGGPAAAARRSPPTRAPPRLACARR